jgi:activator of HSP90 ATPase
VRKLYTACFENDTSPSDDRILACLKKVCGEHHDKVFIAIDGLDECTEEEQVTLVQYLKEMPSNTRIMVASRYLPIIEQRLDTKLRVNVYPHADDVRRYLETEMKCNSTFGRLMNSGTTGKSGDLRSMVEAAVPSHSVLAH